ncbi:F0F1 ATP synthase subunit A [Salibacter halophilus]
MYKMQYFKGLLKSLVLIFLSATVAIQAQASQDEGKEFNPGDVIMHHIADSHGWHLWDYTDENGEKHAVSIPLPVILFHNGGLDMFMSSAFHHGEEPVTKGDVTYIMHHSDIYIANEAGGLDFDEEHHPTNAQPLDLSITKNVFMMLLSGVLLLVLFGGAARSYRKSTNGSPRGLASFLEPLVVFVRDDIAKPNIGDKYHRFMPYLLTIFFFIWINNLIGLIPFFPGGANVTGNIAFTLTLSVFTFIVTNVNGNKHYWRHIFATPGVPIAVLPIMALVEFIGIFTKPFALMVRLFANITAGHIIILSLVSLIFVFESVFISPISIGFGLFMNVLELLVAALQAYIFTLLSAMFIGGAVEEHH